VSLLRKCKDIPDIFELVKKAVYSFNNRTRSGLMLGLSDLGEGKYAWIGGYHVLATNAIVMNERPLNFIEKYHPILYKPYVFIILLHEYIHTLGVIDENECRKLTLAIAEANFGDDLVTNLARNIEKYLPLIQNPQSGWTPPNEYYIKYIKGFDRSSVTYIV
jgi:hypothetical protein